MRRHALLRPLSTGRVDPGVELGQALPLASDEITDLIFFVPTVIIIRGEDIEALGIGCLLADNLELTKDLVLSGQCGSKLERGLGTGA